MILVAGEALIDLVPGTDGGLEAHPGGGPYNVARTAARLGAPVAFLGRISTDRFGQRLARELAADGVDLEAVVRTEDPTTLALAELDGDASARYRFYGAGTSAAGLSTDEALRVLPGGCDALHVGTLGLVLEPLADAIEAVVRGFPEQGLVMVDPNCRPTAISDRDLYRDRVSRILERADVVKVSDEDLEYLHPGRDPIEAARAMLGQGPSLALITRHSRGAVVVRADGSVVVATPSATVVDTVGAGDAFCGAFLAWWRARGLGREDLEAADAPVEATRYACLVAAMICERAGALPPTAAELAARFPRAE